MEDKTRLTPPSEMPTELATRILAPQEKTRVNASVKQEKSGSNEERFLLIGDKIKQRFILDSLLGEGGMGAVYRALDLRKQEAGDPQPYVAIKILGDAFKRHPRALITLQREAKKTQQLAHPNIVTVYDFDRDDDLIYLTMEELKGQSLSDLLKHKDKIAALSFKEKTQLILQIAQALTYAHAKGLIHSDLKPANIFVTNEGTIKVLDFGIARAANQEGYQDNFDAGELGALTYSYASLEMLNSESPHPSDDIYALGIIACQIFGGNHPYGDKPANIALKEKLYPDVPAVGNVLLRRLLLRSVALRRRDRVADSKSFLNGFYRAIKAPRRILIGITLILIMGIANYFYVQTIQVEEVPFDSLTLDQQQQFKQLISEGNMALSVGDLEGATHNANQAFTLHQTHVDIKKLTDKIRSIIQENIDKAETDEEKEFFNDQLQALKQHPAFAKEDD
jgi:serine/threonine protein kinase